MTKKILLPYEEAKPLIKEADVFFIRGIAFASWFIKHWTQSEYSHVGLASWSDNILEIIEFDETKGIGTSTNFDYRFPAYSKCIDVYRPDSYYQQRTFNPTTRLVEDIKIELKPRDITQTMRSLTGRPYGFQRIWMFFQRYLFFSKFFCNPRDLTKDDDGSIIYPVCSTSIAYSFAKFGFILLRNRSYEWITPGDLSLSPTLNYLFTIV